MKIKPYIDLIGSLVTFTSLENLYAYSRMYGLCTHHSYMHLFILNNDQSKLKIIKCNWLAKILHTWTNCLLYFKIDWWFILPIGVRVASSRYNIISLQNYTTCMLFNFDNLHTYTYNIFVTVVSNKHLPIIGPNVEIVFGTANTLYLQNVKLRCSLVKMLTVKIVTSVFDLPSETTFSTAGIISKAVKLNLYGGGILYILSQKTLTNKFY